MIFPISGVEINPFGLVAVGFFVGLLGGFFGVGGSFLAGPALSAFGVPTNFMVGTDLAHIVGKSIVAARKHRMLGNIDLKLGVLMALGTVGGVELGAQLIEWLKPKPINGIAQKSFVLDCAVQGTFVVVLLAISSFMALEAYRTWQMTRRQGTAAAGPRGDHSAYGHLARRVQRLPLGPFVSLPTSGIPRISLGAILVVSFVGGMFSGFLGGGAGYIRMPAMIYLLGIPTHIAVGTDLFEIIVSAGYGTWSHAMKGNVDIMIALVMHTGAALGAQIGATLTQYFGGPRIRLAFIPLPVLGAGIMIYKLATGLAHH